MIPWLLHASDPHLGDVAPGQDKDDHKVELTGQADRETTQRVFLRTLLRLRHFVEEYGLPSAVVISGDLTYQGRPKGFARFAKLLADRTDVLGDDPARILVVPGNHDVIWGTPAGSPERYEPFLRATRAQGCVTPLLDGVDFDPQTGELRPAAARHPHVISTDDMLVVALNSSNWCGTDVETRGAWNLDQWTTALEPLEDATRKEILAQLGKLRQHDIPRVSRWQIEALADHLTAIAEPLSRAQDPERVRVAVIHHQLLPLSTREERKPYESLMNLGLVRETLRDYGFDLVLHGHKHESGIYWDAMPAGEPDLDAPLQRTLVIASPGEFGADAPAMRALMLQGPRTARNLEIVTFNGPGPSRNKAQIASRQIAPLWVGAMRAETRQRTTLRGRDAHTTYARLHSQFALRDGTPISNLVCHVDAPGDALTLPPDYPELGMAQRQTWFDQLVAWWQLERSELVDRGIVAFNHGERIYRRWGDQVDRATRLLNRRGSSSRALIELIAPEETGRYRKDSRNIETGSFPAFALAEFTIARRHNRRELDCIGYFRKQEMQYWWPVNLAELRSLQQRVAGGIDTTGIHTGHITTFSAIALWGQDLPAVAVPELDRLVESPQRLWAMGAAAAFPADASGDALADWRRVLDDLHGTVRDAPPRPRLGAELLASELERFAGLPGAADVSPVAAALRTLAQHYASQEGQPELNAAAIGLIRDTIAQLRTVLASTVGDRADELIDPDRDDA